jgi:hypothetical protein
MGLVINHLHYAIARYFNNNASKAAVSSHHVYLADVRQYAVLLVHEICHH